MNANQFDGGKFGTHFTSEDKATALDVLRKMQEMPRWAAVADEVKGLYAALEQKLAGTSGALYNAFDEQQVNIMLRARTTGQI